MVQFIKLLPDGKSVTCLDDLLSLKVSELEKILFSYNEKVSSKKAGLVLHTYTIFLGLKMVVPQGQFCHPWSTGLGTGLQLLWEKSYHNKQAKNTHTSQSICIFKGND